MSYIHREVLTALFVLASFWPTTYGLKFVQDNALLASAWLGLCLLMSSFTLLDANKVENISLMLGNLLIMETGPAR
jgi:GPI ethanolamine phosphate transferase 1